MDQYDVITSDFNSSLWYGNALTQIKVAHKKIKVHVIRLQLKCIMYIWYYLTEFKNRVQPLRIGVNVFWHEQKACLFH